MDVSSVGPFSAASQAQTAMLATLVGAQQQAKLGAQIAEQISGPSGNAGAQAPGNFQVYA